jgi:hypothetical protein
MSYKTNMRDLKNAGREYQRRQEMDYNCEQEKPYGYKREEACCNTCWYSDQSGKFLVCTWAPLHVEISNNPQSKSAINKSPEDHCCGQWRHK